MTSQATKIFDTENRRAANAGLAGDANVEAIAYNYSVISPDELCGGVAEKWECLRQSSQQFVSPYFDIEFTKAVARVRNDVKIVLAVDNEEIVSILPYQLNRPGHAVPAGGRLNDWHGIIGRSSPELIQQMLKAAGLKTYSFHALPTETKGFDEFKFSEVESHHMDLSEGWDQFRSWIRKHSSTVKRQGQKTRNLVRDFGEIRFEFDCDSDSVLESLIEMKRAKYQRSKTFDILSVDWASDLLREVHTSKGNGFQGLLSSMWAGDELVVVHFGMLTGDILHYWFPVYDPKFSKYSPGTEMMLLCAKEACDRGIRKLDLGYGNDAYKFKFCNGRESVINGQVNYNSWAFGLAKRRYEIRNQLKGIPLKPHVKSVLRKFFPGFGQWNFR